MIDDKVCNALIKNTSAQVCFICKITPKDINNIFYIKKRPVNHKMFTFNLLPLHTWIRIFECLIHVIHFMFWCILLNYIITCSYYHK
jgi:hypothetical protein